MSTDNKVPTGFASPGFELYPRDDFDGLWEVLWTNGRIRFRGTYKRGLKAIGQHLFFWENGNLAEISYWQDGFPSGVEIKFREDGSKESEKDYGEHGGYTKSWTERLYDSTNSQLFMLTVVTNNKVVAEWTRPDMREIFDQIELNKCVEEAVNRVYPNK